MVKLEIPFIYWHGNRDRIMSIDFHPHTKLFVTGGSDSEYNSSFSNDSPEFKGYIKVKILMIYDYMVITHFFITDLGAQPLSRFRYKG